MQALALIIGCRNIRKGRDAICPTCSCRRRHQECLLFYRTERSNLQNLLISQFIHIQSGRFQNPLPVPWQRFHKPRQYNDGARDDALTYDDCRIIITVGSLDNLLYIFRKDGVLAHLVAAYKTAGSIGGDVTVDEMFYLTEV